MPRVFVIVTQAANPNFVPGTTSIDDLVVVVQYKIGEQNSTFYRIRMRLGAPTIVNVIQSMLRNLLDDFESEPGS